MSGTKSSSSDEFDKNRADIYIELAKLSQASFFNRQSYEWKVAFGFWTAIGLVTYFAVEHADRITDYSVNWLGRIYLVLGLAWFFA